jgi:hypothetical protein
LLRVLLKKITNKSNYFWQILKVFGQTELSILLFQQVLIDFLELSDFARGQNLVIEEKACNCEEFLRVRQG